MTIPSCKELLKGKKIVEANVEDLESAKEELNNIEPDIEDEKAKKAKKNRLYRIDKEIKLRKENVSKEIKSGSNYNWENDNEDNINIDGLFDDNASDAPAVHSKKDELLMKLNAISAMTGECEYAADDFSSEDEIKKVLAAKTEKIFQKGDLYVPFAYDIFMKSNALIEVGAGYTSSYFGSDNVMEGYIDNLKMHQDMIKDALKEMMRDNPEIMGYLSPTTRLGIAMLLATSGTIMKNKFRGNDGNIENVQS